MGIGDAIQAHLILSSILPLFIRHRGKPFCHGLQNLLVLLPGVSIKEQEHQSQYMKLTFAVTSSWSSGTSNFILRSDV